MHFYCAGDKFPRAGLEVSDERLQELSTTKNLSKMILIEKIEVEEDPAVKKEEPEILEEKKEVVKGKGRRKNARTDIESN